MNNFDKNARVALTLTAILASWSVAQAQEVAKPEAVAVPPSTTAPTATVATPDTAVKSPRGGKDAEYRISREDTLAITCLNAQEYSMVATVLPDGTISYPKIGRMVVANKTPREVEAAITRFLKKEFIRPQVSVAIRDRQVRQVAVIGSGVKLTGKRVMRDGWHVLDAISDAGGLLSDRTDLFTAKLVRSETSEQIPIDLTSAYNDRESASNLLLEPNDLLIIDAAEESKSQVQVSGEVIKPGFVIIPRDHTVSKALQDAGGVKPSALLSGAVIERNGEKIPIDLRQFVKDGTEPAVRLQPGDKLVVPENRRVVYMVGAFNRQGATLVPDDRPMTLVQAISDAGVPLQNAETKKTQVVRANEDGTKTTTVVDVESMLKKADYSKDVVLQPGDIVYVPFKGGRKFNLMDGVGTVSGLANLRWLFFR